MKLDVILNTNDKDAILFFIKRGETPLYISTITGLNINKIKEYSMSLGMTTDPPNAKAIAAWTKYSIDNNFIAPFIKSTKYNLMKRTFLAGYELNC